MKKQLLIFAIASMLLSCGGKTYKPIFTGNSVIERIPNVEFASDVNIPSDEIYTLNFSIESDATPDDDNYFNNPGAKKSKSGKRPSVIIAPPKVIEISGKKEQAYEEDEDGMDKIFGTDGYYNEAEQVIEKALLRIGFNVLDRSKFEAKLRDLRDNAADRRTWWHNSWSEQRLENGEYDVLKEHYKKQFDDGRITPEQYAEIIDEVNKQSKRGLPGKKREEDEMNDIAEVIRAAQTGADQAEYLLQINEVVVTDAGDRFIPLQNVEEVREFIFNHQGLQFGDLPNGIPSSIPSRWLRASFNAKLIEVKSGSIVWLGAHEIESSDALEIEISFNIDKSVANADEINSEVKDYNRLLRSYENELTDVEKELGVLYTKAGTEVKLKSSDEVKFYTQKLRSSLSKKQNQYKSAFTNLEGFVNNAPTNSYEKWDYEYNVSQPVVSPDFISMGNSSVQGKQKLMQHRKALINKVTQELINTIVIE